MGAASAAQASVAYCTAINSAKLKKEISMATKYGNTAKAAALEQALANIETTCAAKELSQAQQKIAEKQAKIEQITPELEQARATLASLNS